MILDVKLFNLGCVDSPMKASVHALKLNERFGYVYDSNVYTLEFHPGLPTLVSVDESVITVRSFVDTKLKVPPPKTPSNP